ncbi:TonB-dependent receptor [Aquirufa ecclesiirivi]|uniref:TonB-dependent receptor domain-containing protein n=1 Tax=Aquirufa ecclesiirivi TaxID=2715124 RepID=UPI0022A85AB8|nr:TonB-dependent receptor [Aquirufa ecclesiirivi]MCZ2473292.1 TonB-dependent receptor [Aquirufa ecclesiirivi]
MKKALLVIILTVANLSIVVSQGNTISGKLIDQLSRQKIEFANVSLWKKDSTVWKGTLSDTLGKFVFSDVPMNIAYLKFQALSYKTRTFSVAEFKQLTSHEIALVPDNQTLHEVIVTGEKAVAALQMDKQTFQTKQFQNAANGTGMDLMQRLPAVTVNTEGEIALRGSTGFVLLVDGKPSTRTPADILAQLPANIIESIELITSPSAKYDADGKAGMINIITKKNTRIGTAWSGNIMNGGILPLRFGSDLQWTFTDKKWSVFAAADYRRFDIDGFRVGEIRTKFQDTLTYMPSQGVRNYMDFQYSFRAGGTFQASSVDQWNWSAYIGEKQTDRTANLHYQDFIRTPAGTDLFSSFNASQSPYKQFFNQNLFVRSGKFQTYNIDYSHTYPNQAKLSLLGLYEFSKLGGPLNNYDTYEGSNKLLLWERSTETSPLSAWRFQLDYSLPLRNNHKLELGYHIRHVNHQGDFLFERYAAGSSTWVSDPNYTDKMVLVQRIHAPYVQLNGAKKQFSYAIGLRSEWMDRTLTHDGEPGKIYALNQIYLFPSLQGIWKLEGEKTLRIGYSRRIERPTSKLMSPFKNHRHAETIETGDPNLLPEIANVLELGLSKGFENISFTATAYVNFLQDKVFRVNEIYSRTILGRTYTNAGNSQSTGMEFLTEIRPSKIWKIYLSGNLYQFDVQGNFRGIETRQSSFNYNLNGNTSLDISPTLRFVWDFTYLSKSVTTQGYDSDLLLSNVSLKYSLWGNKANVNLQCLNVFNSNIQTIVTQTPSFYSSTDYRKWDRVIQLSVGFRINDRGQKTKSTKTEYGEKDF